MNNRKIFFPYFSELCQAIVRRLLWCAGISPKTNVIIFPSLYSRYHLAADCQHGLLFLKERETYVTTL